MLSENKKEKTRNGLAPYRAGDDHRLLGQSLEAIRDVSKSSLQRWRAVLNPVYTIQPVVKPDWQPVVSCKRDFRAAAFSTADHFSKAIFGCTVRHSILMATDVWKYLCQVPSKFQVFRGKYQVKSQVVSGYPYLTVEWYLIPYYVTLKLHNLDQPLQI